MAIAFKLTQPVLGERAQRYKRNTLAISVTGILLHYLPGVSVDQLAPFGLKVGESIWPIGIALLGYHLLYFWPLSYASWSKFEQEVRAGLGGLGLRVLFGHKHSHGEGQGDHVYSQLVKENGLYYIVNDTLPRSKFQNIRIVAFSPGALSLSRWHILSFLLMEAAGTIALALWAAYIAAAHIGIL